MAEACFSCSTVYGPVVTQLVESICELSSRLPFLLCIVACPKPCVSLPVDSSCSHSA